MSQYIANPDETKELLPRYKLFYLAIGVTFFMITLRLWYLQIYSGNELREFSEKNRIKDIKVTAPRGLFLDRDGKILVENHPGFELILSPQYIKDENKISEQLAPLINTTPEKFYQRLQKMKRQNGPYSQVRMKDDLSREEVFRLKKIRLDVPGMDIRENVVRYYPMKENSAQLFGYVGEISKKQIPMFNELYKGSYIFDQGDLVGKAGLEEVLEREIRGRDGRQFVQVDAYGRETRTSAEIYGEKISDLESEPGFNTTLTIDKDIQMAAWKAFTDLKRIGGVIAMKSNGEILAWVSNPSYDPNDFARGPSPQMWSSLINDPNKPLRNKVIQDHYAPGSTFKSFVALAALSEKVITPTTQVAAPGSFKFAGRVYHDAHKEGHGIVTVYEALEQSSNVFFFKMGIALGIEKMYNYISPFGLGSKTGIDLNREASGTMPNSAWKKAELGEEWQPGENLSNAIGQGFVQATPLQMAVAYNAIGTRGKVVRPFIIKEIRNLEDKVVKSNQASIVHDLTQVQSTGISIQPETFQVVVDSLKKVVQGARGTARAVNIPGADIAGKTGTSQVMSFSADQIYKKCDSRSFQQRHHGWFIAFAPADKPEITVAALTEHSCSGAGGSGPIVKEIMRTYFEKYHPEMIAEYLKKNPRKGQAPSENSGPAVEGE